LRGRILQEQAEGAEKKPLMDANER
jgi:hypothetical protein